MDCSQIRELADDYVFGLLEATQEREIQAHIDSCDTCARIIAEARSRRETLDTWDVPSADGAADRLLALVTSGKAVVPVNYGPLVIRLLSAAAVILAAVVLPMLFMVKRPEVLGYEPQMTSIEGQFSRQVVQELNIPAPAAGNSCIVVRIASMTPDLPLRALVKLNESRGIEMAAQNEQTVILTNQHGLAKGRNLLKIQNLGQAQLEFEVTLVTGSAR